MQITDEAVEAAWVGWVNTLGKNRTTSPAMRAALEAALMLTAGERAAI